MGEIYHVLFRCLAREQGNSCESDIEHGIYCIQKMAEELEIDIFDKNACEVGNKEFYDSPEAKIARKIEEKWRMGSGFKIPRKTFL